PIPILLDCSYFVAQIENVRLGCSIFYFIYINILYNDAFKIISFTMFGNFLECTYSPLSFFTE
ncbi:MAG: hypothetical protein WCF06_00555, partial [Nitrososphaeraceae archaeon]